MSLRVLVIPDKFKGTLTTEAAGAAIAAGWCAGRPSDTVQTVAMSDGGDGFGAILGQELRAKIKTARVVDAAHRPHDAQWWSDARTKTAVIESARAIGLALLPPKQFHPFQLDTRGLGELLLAASRSGARRCFIGIGGSATNDGGFGMAHALGWHFLDRHGGQITTWTELHRLERLVPPRRRRLFTTTTVAVDVQNPLLGLKGCSRIYGPQKGLRPDDFALAERCLGRLARVATRQYPALSAKEPGTGAAGGLGFGLRLFLGARLQPGFALFARHARLLQRLRQVDLVITGEGALDKSTLMGKGVGEIGLLCKRLKLPCLALGGVLADPVRVKRLFSDARAITPDLTTPANAMAHPDQWLFELARKTAAQFQLPRHR